MHGAIGYNYRLTNIQAALGCAQLEMLDEYIDKKRSIAARYEDGLGNVTGITTMSQAAWAESIFWLYTILVDEGKFGMASRSVLKSLEQRGIQTRPLWQPMHRSPVHGKSETIECPIADWIYARALSLPCSVGLTESDQDFVIQSLVELQERR